MGQRHLGPVAVRPKGVAEVLLDVRRSAVERVVTIALVQPTLEEGNGNEAHEPYDRELLGHEAPSRTQVHLGPRSRSKLAVQDVRVDDTTLLKRPPREPRVAAISEALVASTREHPTTTTLRRPVPGQVSRTKLVVGVPIPYQVRDDGA